ncbi:MAG: dynamin family protein [Anaerolineae bacterium]|nr:dynamin family protein [Anaerolineae bacterium]
MEDTLDTRLVTAYEAIRRREYEVINDLLTVLPKIETLGEERVAQVRDALFHADHPYLMVFVGPFNSGKSSLINALLGAEELLTVGPVPTTDRISILRWGIDTQRMESGGDVDTVFHPSSLLKRVSFVDTPGLESIFQKHEETTRKFLHRSDVVVLVMLATQAMTQRNIEYLQQLREYGKKVLIVINQADLLTPDEQDAVRQYVLDQSQDRLNLKVPVWMVSAKTGKSAWDGETVNPEIWAESGLHQFEKYLDEQLDDVERLRQKLQTPLQITQNVHKVALEAVKANQSVLDQYQSIADNVQQQLNGYEREQQKIVREQLGLINAKFADAIARGRDAIHEVFQWSHTLRSMRWGCMDLLGLSRIFQRMRKNPSYTRLVFEERKVYEPLDQLQEVVGQLGPRLEGKDLQDVDDLVKYAQKEIKALPETIRGKVIGDIRAPVKYDRTPLQEIRTELESIEAESRLIETERIENGLRNSVLFLATFELVLGVIFIVVTLINQFDFGTFLVFLGLAIIGFFTLPILGRFLASGHTDRMLKLQARYVEVVGKAGEKQVKHGMALRNEVVAPLTRLVEAQTQIQNEQLNKLQKANQQMVEIESELTKLGKKRLFGR